VTPVLIDTGCIVALLDRSERNHEACAAAVHEIDVPILTCEGVIAEACYLLRNIRNAQDTLLQNVEAGVFLVPYRLTGNAISVRKLIKKYADVPMDFADACLVDMAAAYQTSRILTLDHDFHLYRWGRNRPFELVISI
jgi:predicted nucleic acid-binding protein